MNDPQSEGEWTTHALNIHGTFFERRVLSLIADIEGWRIVSSNVPVEFPAPNGPLRGEQSSTDVWAAKKSGQYELNVIVECKQRNPAFTKWVFFQDVHGSRSALPNITFDASRPSSERVQSILAPIAYDMALGADPREVRGDYLSYKRQDLTKTSNTAVWDAAYQVSLAMRAIFDHQMAIFKKVAGASGELPISTVVFLPVIVRTANLYMCTFENSQVDLNTGALGLTDAKYTPVDQLIYQYPLPVKFQFTPAGLPEDYESGKSWEIFRRSPILVINSSHVASTLQDLR